MATTTTTNEHQSLAAKYMAEERWIDAKRELVQVNKELLTLEEEKAIERGEHIEKGVNEIKKGIDPSWKGLGDFKKNGREFSCSYHIQWTPLLVGQEMEFPVERSLARYIIAVLNEVDLFKTWTPKWKKPRFEFVRTEVLRERGITQRAATLRVAAPLAHTEVYGYFYGNDDTEVNREGSVNIDNMDVGEEDGLVPPHEEGIRRARLNATLLFRKCPADRADKAHQLLVKSGKAKADKKEEFILCTVRGNYGNPKTMLNGGFFVRNMANFMLKIVTPMMMNMLFTLCEEVRDGKRPEFDKKIAENPKCYEWLDNVVEGILRD